MTKGALCVIYEPIIIDSSTLIYYKVKFSLMYLGIFPVGNAGRDFPLLLFFDSYLKELQTNSYLSIFIIFSNQLLQIPLVFGFIHVPLQNRFLCWGSYNINLMLKLTLVILLYGNTNNIGKQWQKHQKLLHSLFKWLVLLFFGSSTLIKCNII